MRVLVDSVAALAFVCPKYTRRTSRQQFLSLLSGASLASYTGVLIGATAIPVWSASARMLPLHFAASGMGATRSRHIFTTMLRAPRDAIDLSKGVTMNRRKRSEQLREGNCHAETERPALEGTPKVLLAAREALMNILANPLQSLWPFSCWRGAASYSTHRRIERLPRRCKPVMPVVAILTTVRSQAKSCLKHGIPPTSLS